jgi:hypothetical protein
MDVDENVVASPESNEELHDLKSPANNTSKLKSQLTNGGFVEGMEAEDSDNSNGVGR